MDDFFRHIRSFLGLPKFDEPRNGYQGPEDGRSPGNFMDSRYDAFLDPGEMHRYFEQQMNKILGEFDIFEFGQNNSLFGDLPGHSEIEFFDQNDQHPSVDHNQQGGELRDQFLKPGFERPTQKNSMDKSDRELKEDEININDLDSIVSGNYFKKQEHPKVTTRFFGRSMTTKTVTNPDGSVEIHKTVRDNEGNEETTITKRIGDKEHTIIKKRDSTGKEEIIQNFVNIDENEAGSLSMSPNVNKPWSLYDRFFK